jgi:hypothetical protein
MTKDRNQHHDRDRTDDPGTTTTDLMTTTSAGALLALESLTTDLLQVDTSAIVGRSSYPMLIFKSRTDGGTWMYGREQTVPEADSRWAVDITSFKRGWICFDASNNNKATERLLPVTQPLIDKATLPDTGYEWKPSWTVRMKCTSGADAGIEVDFKATTDGALSETGALFERVRQRLAGRMHSGKVCPIVELECGSYHNKHYGPTALPVLKIVDWMPLAGPAPEQTPPPAPAPAAVKPPQPAPAPSSSATAAQPRRRRVA